MTSTLRKPHDTAGMRLDLDRFGYCMAQGVLDEGRLQTAARDVENASRRKKQRSADADEWLRDGDEWVVLIVGECTLDAMVCHPLALAMAHHLLGKRIMLSGYTAHIIHPGNQEMNLHTDQWWLPRATCPSEPPNRPGDITRTSAGHGTPAPASHPVNPAVVINVMWAISDFTRANGCTRLVPGSHLSGAEPHPDQTLETVHAEIPAGGVVMWDARTWHGSGSNTTQSSRIGVSITYCGPQFRQLQNHTLAVHPDVHGTLDDTMRVSG